MNHKIVWRKNHNFLCYSARLHYLCTMLQRDYFIRILQEFMAAVQRFLEKKEEEGKRDVALRDLYRQYIGSYDDLRNLTVEEAIAYAHDVWEADRRMGKLEMLAGLWHAEGVYKADPLRTMLLEKAFQLYDYVDTHSGEYSLTRKERMRQIKEMTQAQ